MEYYEYLYANIFYIVTLIAGLGIVLSGILFARFPTQPFGVKRKGFKRYLRLLEKPLNRAVSFFPMRQIRQRLDKSLEVTLFEEKKRRNMASVLAVLLALIRLLLSALLFTLGQVWYSRITLSGMGLVLPFYTVTLLLDLYRYRITKQIPQLIDKFRGAFIRHNKIRPALKECSRYVDRGLGRIMSRAADSVFLEDSLNTLKQQFSNVWFNIFVVLIVNYKENGGELTDQLYRLNRTMTRLSSIERKKSRRLIWYEVFTVGAAALSIPAIFWMNGIILGQQSVTVDARTNMMISEVMLFSAISLVIVRVLRKM